MFKMQIRELHFYSRMPFRYFPISNSKGGRSFVMSMIIISDNHQSQVIVPETMEVDQAILMEASTYISVNHILPLAIVYLGLSKPEIDNMTKDGSSSSQIIFDCLLAYCVKHSCGTTELSDVLEKAGKEEGLIKRIVVDILRGNNSILIKGYKATGK